MKRTLALTAVAFVAAGAYTFYNETRSTASAPQATSLPAAANAQAAADVDTSGIIEMSVGAEDAPVTVIEYASFTCPHCKNFHQGTYPELKANYIETGKVRFVYREVYFDRYGLWAGMVARCGGPERYFGIADLIYDQQSEWARGEPGQIVEALRRIGRTAGLSDDQLDTCLTDSEKAEALYALYQTNAQADGVRSTPSFVVNGELHSGNMSYAAFSEIIDDAIGD